MGGNEYYVKLCEVNDSMTSHMQYVTAKTTELEADKAKINNEYGSDLSTRQAEHDNSIKRNNEACEAKRKSEEAECKQKFDEYLKEIPCGIDSITCYGERLSFLPIPNYCKEVGTAESGIPNRYRPVKRFGKPVSASEKLDRIVELYKVNKLGRLLFHGTKKKLCRKFAEIIRFEEDYYKQRALYHEEERQKQEEKLKRELAIDLKMLETENKSKLEMRQKEYEDLVHNDYVKCLSFITSKSQELKNLQQMFDDNCPSYYYSHSEWESFTPALEANKKSVPLGFAYMGSYNKDFIVPVFQDKIPDFIQQTGFSPDSYSFRVPCLLDGTSPIRLFIDFDEGQKNSIVEAVQCMIVKIARDSLIGGLKVTVIDPKDRGSNIGQLQSLSEDNDCPLIKNVSDEDTALSALKSIVNKIDDISRKSIAQENAGNDSLAHQLLVIFDYQELEKNANINANLKIILNNSQKCNVSVILVSQGIMLSAYDDFTDYVDAKGGKILWKESTDTPSYSLILNGISIISRNFIAQMREHYCKPIDNRFERFYDLSNLQPTKDSTESIVIPIAVDIDDQLVDFELGGASSVHAMITGSIGSGKSTLLHSIINGILLNYSPDDVELWLVDYKKMEFIRYAENTPPHVRLVGLENSFDFTYSLIDKLENIYDKERKNLFAEIGAQKLAQYNNSQERDKRDLPHLPRIVVIIDEFHNFSNALEENDSYKRRFSKMLRQCRAVGLSFILADQACSKGLRGLTEEGRNQISVRVAMNNVPEEIYETLITTASTIGETIRAMINNFTIGDLILRRPSADGTKMILAKALNITSDNISNISSHTQNTFNTPIEPLHFIDGRERVNADEKVIKSYIDKQMVAGKIKERNIAITCGVPMSLEECLHFNFMQKDNEHILLISNLDELKMSIIYYTIHSFIRNKNNRAIVIGDETEILFADYQSAWRNLESMGLERHLATSDICKCIKGLSDGLYDTRAGSTLLVGIGLDGVFKEIQRSSKAFPKSESKYDLEVAVATVDFEMGDNNYPDTADASLELTPDNLVFGSKNHEKITTPTINNDHTYDAQRDFAQLAEYGGKRGLHLLLALDDFRHLTKRYEGIHIDYFNHRIGTRMSDAYTRDFFGSNIVIDEDEMEKVACYSTGNKSDTKMFRPFLLSNFISN